MVSTTQVAEQFKGLMFPCRKEECLRFVKERGAPEELRRLVESMPERRLDSMADVWLALGEVS